ncbi:MAG TPA: alpha/beta hydrolase-fold protein [Chitinophagaceae bacterium]
MKKILLPLYLLMAMASAAQSGKVMDNLSLKSKVLNMERQYAVYLPPDYETSQRSYPVLYLLHGSGDDQTGWVQFGEVLRITDGAIRDGIATPMVIIMPDANTGQRGYNNDIQGKWRYEDFFFTELMPHVEKTYRIKGEKRFRAVAGLSMGGYGSFLYALHRPDLFSAAAPLSAWVGPLTEGEARGWTRAGELKVADTTFTRFYREQTILELVKALPDTAKKAVRWYIDCGDDDFLYEGNSLVHIAMKKKEVPHEFRVRDGAHTWTYWRESLPEVLRFVSMGFHQY